jgi:uncharacterized protein YkwD
MKSSLAAVLAVLLIAGCVQQVYVCPDGSTTSSIADCQKPVGDEIAVGVAETVTIEKVENYNASNIEKAIFDLVNENRASYGLKPLLWNDEIARIAREKSNDMAERNYFNHANPDGKTFSDILKENNVFYLTASENIAMFSNFTNQNLASEVVAGWLNSPAHRVPILDMDEIYTDTGVGVNCSANTCYFTMQFLNLEKRLDANLQPRYGTFVYIYDPALEFRYNVSVVVEVNSTRQTDTYIVDDRNNYDLFLQGYPIYFEKEFRHTSYVNTSLLAQKGYGIIVYSDPDYVYGDAEVKVSIRYNP